MIYLLHIITLNEVLEIKRNKNYFSVMKFIRHFNGNLALRIMGTKQDIYDNVKFLQIEVYK